MEVPVGLFPAWGLDAVIRRVGVPAARRLAWGIDTLSGREAHALGLADEIVEGNVLSVAMERARAIAGLPRPIVRTRLPISRRTACSWR